MSNDLEYAKHLADKMEASAEWRRIKAEEYPDDATRNLECAREFDEMAKRFRAFQGGPWYECFMELTADENASIAPEMANHTASIYFTAEEPEEFFERWVKLAKETA